MIIRPRRNRQSAAIRELAQETHLNAGHLVQPIFLVDGHDIKQEIPSLPGSFRLSIDHVFTEVEECMQHGVKSFIMFPAVI